MAFMVPQGLPMPSWGRTGASASAGQAMFRKYGMAMRFNVTIDGLALGHWASCEGLKVEFTTESVKDGGHYDYEPALPAALKYSAITLRRAMIKSDSDQVMKWLETAAAQWTNYDGTTDPYRDRDDGTAQITLLDVYGGTVQNWKLRGVRPSSWSGPSLTAEQSKVAVETLVIEHQGFL